MKPDFSERLRLAELELETVQRYYLQSRGWKHTSSTPGHVWLWTREWQGKQVLVGTATAIDMQRGFDEDAVERITLLVQGQPRELPDLDREDMDTLGDLWRALDLRGDMDRWETLDASGERVAFADTLGAVAYRPMPLHFLPRPGEGG